MKTKILLVDDDPAVHELLVVADTSDLMLGFTLAEGWQLFEESLQETELDLIIIRERLKPDALKLVQQIRGAGYDGPMMILSGNSERWERFLKPGLCTHGSDGADLLPKIKEALASPGE